MKLNIFNNPRHDFDTMLQVRDEVVLVNKVATRGILTTPQFADKNEKYLSTKEKIHRGDIVQHNNRQWYVMSQSDQPRYESYKAKIELIEHVILFNLKPVMDEDAPPMYILHLPVIAFEPKSPRLVQSSGGVISQLDSEMHMYVQENDMTALMTNGIGDSKGRILFKDVAWEILHINRTRNGLMEIILKSGLKNEKDNWEDGVFDATHDEVVRYSDKSLLMEDDSPAETGKLPPIDTNTDVSVVGLDQETNILSFTKDSNSTTYDTLWGYQVVLYGEFGILGYSELHDTGDFANTDDVVNVDITNQWNQSEIEDWYVEIHAIYKLDDKVVRLVNQDIYKDEILNGKKDSESSNTDVDVPVVEEEDDDDGLLW